MVVAPESDGDVHRHRRGSPGRRRASTRWTPTTSAARSRPTPGTSATGGPRTLAWRPTSHVYARPGKYNVNLTTTNAGGCASRRVFTGHTAACSGATTATTRRIIDRDRTRGDGRDRPGERVKTTVGEARRHGRGERRRRPLALRVRHHRTPTGGRRRSRAARARSAPRSTKLKPNTRYHYRLVATTDGGVPPVDTART